MNWWANAIVWAIFVPQIQNTKKKKSSAGRWWLRIVRNRRKNEEEIKQNIV